MSSKSVKEDRDARRSRRAAEGAQAMSDYLKAEAAIRERTAQLGLSALEEQARLSREADMCSCWGWGRL